MEKLREENETARMKEAAGSADTAVAGNWTNLLFWEFLISGMILHREGQKNMNKHHKSFEAGEWRRSRESVIEKSAVPRPCVNLGLLINIRGGWDKEKKDKLNNE